MMKRVLLLFLLFLLTLALPLGAQEATLNVPIPRTSEAKYTVSRLLITAQEARIVVSVRDAGDAEIREHTFTVPDASAPSATIAGIFTALDTVRANETGGVLRRANYRVLGFLVDNGYVSGVTLVP